MGKQHKTARRTKPPRLFEEGFPPRVTGEFSAPRAQASRELADIPFT